MPSLAIFRYTYTMGLFDEALSFMGEVNDIKDEVLSVGSDLLNTTIEEKEEITKTLADVKNEVIKNTTVDLNDINI